LNPVHGPKLSSRPRLTGEANLQWGPTAATCRPSSLRPRGRWAGPVERSAGAHPLTWRARRAHTHSPARAALRPGPRPGAVERLAVDHNHCTGPEVQLGRGAGHALARPGTAVHVRVAHHGAAGVYDGQPARRSSLMASPQNGAGA
jgi:hypothetical protein